MEKLHYCYILRCADQSLYTGYATEPQKRLAAHNSGKGAKYTKAHGPCSLVYLEAFESKEEAMRREYEIKHRFSKPEKEALILPCTGMGPERLLEYALSLIKDKKDGTEE